uniref:Uncharacterized protein n=1 Tax=Rhizophagus irregularis (strain DAOM 181602 / DAOM 197198 / MUCL 43194) TaxID=747089 RepID=U9T6F0_RHIID
MPDYLLTLSNQVMCIMPVQPETKKNNKKVPDQWMNVHLMIYVTIIMLPI